MPWISGQIMFNTGLIRQEVDESIWIEHLDSKDAIYNGRYRANHSPNSPRL